MRISVHNHNREHNRLLTACWQILNAWGCVVHINQGTPTPAGVCGGPIVFRRRRRIDALTHLDLDGCGPNGRHIAVEVKTGRGRLSLAQAGEIALLRHRGAVVIVARCLGDIVAHREELTK